MNSLTRPWAYPVKKQITDEMGKTQFSSQPIGCLDQEGKFSSYDYLVKETKAAPGHMLSEKTLEFQFEYKDEKTPLIELTYDPVNDSNRALVKKAFKGYRRVSGRCCFETGTGRKGNFGTG